jgi:hypothetical protein
LVEEVDPEELTPDCDDADDIDDIPETVAVPNTLAQEDGITAIRQQIMPQKPHLTLPSFRQTPLSEFNRSQPLLSWAFPTLFPRGVAEYTTAWERSVKYTDYIKHHLRYHDHRFARHPWICGIQYDFASLSQY